MLARLLLLALPAFAAEPGFTDLFDGRSLKGWTMLPDRTGGYFVEQGLLVSAPDYKGNLFTDAEYGNFVLRFEFRMTPGANNGIGIRAPLQGDAAYSGMEVQILDDDHERYRGKIQPWQFHGSIYNIVAAKSGFLKPAGEWNQEEIGADGSHIVIKLNGAVIVDADLSTVTDPEVIRRHPGMKRASGHIGLLGHESRVEFRNMRIKKL